MFGSRREAKTYQKGVFETSYFGDRYLGTWLWNFFGKGFSVRG